MATKIRLQRGGRKSYAFYRIVVADARAPRDGRFTEKIGTYNPNTNPATVDLNFDRLLPRRNSMHGRLISRKDLRKLLLPKPRLRRMLPPRLSMPRRRLLLPLPLLRLLQRKLHLLPRKLLLRHKRSYSNRKHPGVLLYQAGRRDAFFCTLLVLLLHGIALQ